MSDREDLKARIDGLSETAVRFVSRMVDSLSSPPSLITKGPATWISSTPDWIEYFGLALSVHHGTTVDALGLTGFETAFANACESVAWSVEAVESSTHRFSDLTVTNSEGISRKLSLKSTAAQRISEEFVLISKLTEAAWIQDVRSARQRRERTLELFKEFRNAVDAIVMLRAFRQPGKTPDRYQLLEIPSEIFRSLEDSSLSDFDSDGPRINCSFAGQERAARVSLDRSDAKVTVSGIRVDVCSIHAEWQLSSSPSPKAN
ncbi:MAG: hypothetical protein OXC99_02835 [Chloroflexi bacterium]|nr:hypothetical protein [Chloroflexota bacterium]